MGDGLESAKDPSEKPGLLLIERYLYLHWSHPETSSYMISNMSGKCSEDATKIRRNRHSSAM